MATNHGNEEWTAWESVITTCEHCGREGVPCQLLPHPVAAELRPDEPSESSYWCRPCYTTAGQDI